MKNDYYYYYNIIIMNEQENKGGKFMFEKRKCYKEKPGSLCFAYYPVTEREHSRGRDFHG